VDLVKLDPNFVPPGAILVDLVKLVPKFVPLASELKPKRTGMAQVNFDLAQIEFFEVFVMIPSLMKPRHP
jgi:hypothetical protein